jgi:hypothetical protein
MISGTINDNAPARHDLSLTIQRLMIDVTRHRHMRDHRLGRETAFNQTRRRRLLHHGAGTGAAGELRPFGHDHAELHRDHVKSF